MNIDCYIYYVICPLEKSIKYLGVGDNFKVLKAIRAHEPYREWMKVLKNKKISPLKIIFDKVEEGDKDFWLDHYNDLFASWGFSLWRAQKIKHLTHMDNQTQNLKSNLTSSYIGSKTFKNFNINIFIYFVNDLLNFSFRDKKIDQLTAVIILTLFYGFRLYKVLNLTIHQLENIFKQASGNLKFVTYPRLEKFIKDFTQRGSSNKINLEIPAFDILGEDNFNSIQFEKHFNNLLQYFGYNASIRYCDFELIFAQIYYHSHMESTNSTEFLVNNLGYSSKYIRAYLNMESKSNFVVPSNKKILMTLLR